MSRHRVSVDRGLRNSQRPKQLLSWFLLSVMLAVAALVGSSKSTFAAAPPAGTTIGNQASATYTDATGANRNATSNTVITVVNQVDAMDLIDNRNKQGAPNATVYFPHTVTNLGNGPDHYSLTAVDVATGDSFDFTNIVIYPDANGDGVPDNFTPITVTPTLAAGESFSFVVAGLVPATATAGQTGQLTVTAASVRTSGLSDTNTDTVTVSSNAIIDVTKSIDNNKGSSSPTPTTHTYTLTYINNGIGPATNLIITDTLNADLVYVGNPTWTQQNGAITTQTSLPSTLPPPGTSPWQAGTGAAQIIYSRSGQVVQLAISNVAPGETGKITFQVSVRSNAAPQVIPNVAEYNYNNRPLA